MNALLKEILDEAKEIKGVVKGVVNCIDGINSRLDVMQGDIDELKSDVTVLKADTASLKVDVRANREMLTGMEMRLGERIDGVRSKTAANTQDIRDMKEQMKKQDMINGKWANDTLSRLKSV